MSIIEEEKEDVGAYAVPRPRDNRFGTLSRHSRSGQILFSVPFQFWTSPHDSSGHKIMRGVARRTGAGTVSV